MNLTIYVIWDHTNALTQKNYSDFAQNIQNHMGVHFLSEKTTFKLIFQKSNKFQMI